MSQRSENKNRGLSMIGIAIAIVVLAVLGGGGFLVYKNAQLKAGQEESDEKPDVLPPGKTQLLFDAPVNISGPDPDTGYIYKVEIRANIVYPDDEKKENEVGKELIDRKPQINDMINELLSRQRYSEIMREGSAIYKPELLAKINSILSSGEVHDLYITGLIVPMN